MKSYVLEVLATNIYHRQHLILNTTEDMIKMGLRPQSVRSVACFEKAVLKGFHLSQVPSTTGHIPGQQDIVNCFLRYPALFNLRHHPVIGQVQEGLYTGKQVALFTQAEIRSHFSLDAIRLAIRQNRPYQQTRWRYAEDYREAQPFYCHPEKQQILDVLRYNYDYSTLPLTENDHRIFRRQVGAVAQALYAWASAGYPPTAASTLERLARIYVQLTKTIRCEHHHHKLLDTLYHLKRAIAYQHLLSDTKIKILVSVLEKVAKG